MEFQKIHKAIIAELRTLRDERAKDWSTQRKPLPAPDFISKVIAKAISDCPKNRLRFQTTRKQTFRRVRRRFERRNDAIKKLLKAHERKVMDIENSCREFEQNKEGLLGLTKWSKSTEAEWTSCLGFPSQKRKPHPPLNESNKSCDKNYLLRLFGTGSVFI
ncbi:hypothetical protein JTB14_021968 [Gonioctena quinquepunctata]|nr:hypothetical protein JTB14_021968 [Gonioctena quinquepunctata]